MKKLKPFLLRLPIYVLIVALIGVGVWKFLKDNNLIDFSADIVPTEETQTPTGERVVNNDEIKVHPQKVIQIGDSYEFCPGKADGHFICTVTGARVVTGQADCPAETWFFDGVSLAASDDTHYDYDEWFAEGGAYDHNCRMIVVDITVTNVDAVSWLNDGTFKGDCGFFNDQYAFHAFDVVKLVNLLKVGYGLSNPRYYPTEAVGFSRFGEYSDDVRGTMGVESVAFRLEPGETISYSLAFPVHAYVLEREDGTLRDLSVVMLCPSAAADSKEDVFIDLKLGE